MKGYAKYREQLRLSTDRLIKINHQIGLHRASFSFLASVGCAGKATTIRVNVLENEVEHIHEQMVRLRCTVVFREAN